MEQFDLFKSAQKADRRIKMFDLAMFVEISIKIGIGMIVGSIILFFVERIVSRCAHRGVYDEYLGQMSPAAAQAAGADQQYQVWMCTKCATMKYASKLPLGVVSKPFDFERAKEIECAVALARQKKA